MHLHFQALYQYLSIHHTQLLNNIVPLLAR